MSRLSTSLSPLYSWMGSIVLLMMVMVCMGTGTPTPLGTSTSANNINNDVFSSQQPGLGRSVSDMNDPQASKIIKHVSGNIEGKIVYVHFIGETGKTVFVRTNKDKIYRSYDFGRNWKYEQIFEEGNGIKRIAVSPRDSNYVFFVGANGKHWNTKDAGVTYKKIGTELPIDNVLLHHFQVDYLLAAHRSCEFGNQGCCNNVYLCQDFGEKCELMSKRVETVAWGTQALDAVVTRFPYKMEKENYQCNTMDDRKMVELVSNGKFQKLAFEHAVQSWVYAPFYTLVTQVDQETKALKLLVSNNPQAGFLPAKLDTPLLMNEFSVLDASEETIFMAVNADQTNKLYSTVYISNRRGDRFSPSLQYLYCPKRGQCDFHKHKGLEGIYFANIVANAEDDPEPENIELVTKVTFNKGASWEDIQAPTVDSQNQDVPCATQGTCQLNLHVKVHPNRGSVPMYSTDSATAIIVAQGAIGTTLTEDDYEVNVYMSRNGGLSWEEIRKGSHTYEFGNQGGILLLAKNNEPSNIVWYSMDMGKTFNNVTFPVEPLHLHNVVIETSAKVRRFLVYGMNDNHETYMMLVDFTNYFERACVKPADFEFFTPVNRMNGKCLMGHKITYMVRKRLTSCFIAPNQEWAVKVEGCPCEEMDFECDVGFERKTVGGPCVQYDKSIDLNKIPSKCVGRYRKITGYRYIAGDTCLNPSEKYIAWAPCPQPKKPLPTAAPVATPTPHGGDDDNNNNNNNGNGNNGNENGNKNDGNDTSSGLKPYVPPTRRPEEETGNGWLIAFVMIVGMSLCCCGGFRYLSSHPREKRQFLRAVSGVKEALGLGETSYRRLDETNDPWQGANRRMDQVQDVMLPDELEESDGEEEFEMLAQRRNTPKSKKEQPKDIESNNNEDDDEEDDDGFDSLVANRHINEGNQDQEQGKEEEEDLDDEFANLK